MAQGFQVNPIPRLFDANGQPAVDWTIRTYTATGTGQFGYGVPGMRIR